MKFIIGPCAIENKAYAIRSAIYLKHLQDDIQLSGYPDFEIIYKSSYSKANRTKDSSFHGVGLKKGLEVLQAVKQETGLRVTSDVHTEHEAYEAGKVLDILQIPHQMCKNTALLEACARTGRIVSVKKSTFMAADDFIHVVDKIRQAGNIQEIIAIERGNCFGYSNIVVDFRNIDILRRLRQENVSVCIDATHPSRGREYAPTLAKAGTAAGVDYVFLEAHSSPNEAPCDGHCMVEFKDLKDLILDILRIHDSLKDCTI